jgi:hypothetical protein
MKKNIAAAIKSVDPTLLSLDYHKVREAVRAKNSFFDALAADEQERTIQAELAGNADRFMNFARPLLLLIYGMKLHPDFCLLLAMRRGHIMSFLQKQQLKANENPADLSRAYISEVICLRILNPQIISIDISNPLLRLLAKVIQSMAKIELFPEETDLFRKMLDPLFRDFLLSHCQFIDRCSIIQKEERHA